MKTRKERVSYGIGRLASIGLSRTQAAGIMGSLMGESGRDLNTGAHNPNDPNGGSSGIAQWHSGRLSGLKSFAKTKGTSWKDFKTQMDYVAHELTTTEKAALERVKKTSNLAAATKTFTNAYERPNQKYANHAGRLANAKHAASLVDGVDVDNVSYEEEAPQIRGIDNPLGMLGDLLSGKSKIEDSFGDVGKLGKNALSLAQGKNVLGSVGGIIDVVDGPQNPLGGLTDFLTKPSPTMKLGALAGGIIGGPQGALIGGLLGQGLGTMLNGFMSPKTADPMTGEIGWGDSNYYPDAPDRITSGRKDSSDRNSWDDRGSKQARDAIDSGSTGLW